MDKISTAGNWASEAKEHLLASGTSLESFAQAGFQGDIIEEAHGLILRAVDGKEYIAGASGAVNVNWGYSRRDLAEAAMEQMLKMSNGGLTPGAPSTAIIEYASKLAQFTPEGLGRFLFMHSGGEANDASYKIARFYWWNKGEKGKYKIISRDLAYHGLSIGSMYATRMMGAVPPSGEFGPPIPGYCRTSAVYCYRCPFDKTYPGCGMECAEALAETIQQEGPETVAAFVAEPIYGVAGTIIPPEEYWPRIREICNQYNILLILDEVMTGFGRTGKNFACEHWDLKPDMLIMSKGMTGAALPLSAVAITEEVFEGMRGEQRFSHFASTGGHPVCCAVATKVLEIIEKEKLVENSAKVGRHLAERLNKLTKSPHIDNVQCLGLFAGLEIAKDKPSKTPYAPESEEIKKFNAAVHDRGLIVRASPKGRLQIAPPLIATIEDIDRIVDILELALKDSNLD